MWILLNNSNTKSFDSYYVNLIEKGVSRSKVYRPLHALPLTVVDIKNIVNCFCKLGRLGLVLTTATLICFYTFLRQSNLLFSMSNRYPEHALTEADVNRMEKALLIRVSSSKTECSPSDCYVVRLMAIKDSKYCPVRAWARYRRRTHLAPGGPAFMHVDGHPLLMTTLLRAFRTARTMSHHPSSHLVTLHSLRRGGAKESACAGTSLDAVRDVGWWRMRMVFEYAPRSLLRSSTGSLFSICVRSCAASSSVPPSKVWLSFDGCDNANIIDVECPAIDSLKL